MGRCVVKGSAQDDPHLVLPPSLDGRIKPHSFQSAISLSAHIWTA